MYYIFSPSYASPTPFIKFKIYTRTCFNVNVNFRLTEIEKREREHKKQLLQLAKDHEKARELERIQRYRMPLQDGKIEPEQDIAENEPPQSEQSKWESDQMSSAVFKFGAKDKKG